MGRFQDADEGACHEHVCSRAGIRVHYYGEQFENGSSIGSNLLKTVKRASGTTAMSRSTGHYPQGVEKIIGGVDAQGACAESDPDTQLLRITAEFAVSVVLARCQATRRALCAGTSGATPALFQTSPLPYA